MRNVNAFLLISAKNHKERTNPYLIWPTPKLDVLSAEGNLYQQVMKLFELVTGVAAFDGINGWVIINPGQIYDDPKFTPDVWIPYGASLAEQVQLTGYEWRTLHDIFHDEKLTDLEKKLVFTAGVNL